MSRFFKQIDEPRRAFIARQPLLLTANAVCDHHVNLSPKGLDTFLILNERAVASLDLTGNETSAHRQAGGRLTLVVCAFEGAPLIGRRGTRSVPLPP